MAKSLVCQECNTVFASVQAAQDHGEATGHANFAESEAAALRLVCAECGKVARSEVERDLHAKRAGHSAWSDQTAAAGAIDTEAQMAAARAELAGGGAVAGAGAAAGGAAGNEEDLVPAEVNEALLAALLEMGFPRGRAVRALHFSGGESADHAMTWLEGHGGDADVDAELLVPRQTAKKRLSPEEARAQAAELLARAKARREGEEAAAERARELARVRFGKEVAAAARSEDEARLRRNADERRREKEEEARAREKIRAKLEQDRKERRAALGLPLELTAEEAEAERRKERERAEAEAARRLPVKPVAVAERMRAVAVEMKKAAAGQDEAWATCVNTLLKLVGNVARAPGEEKFRRVRLGNPAVAARLGPWREGAAALLELAGFRRAGAGADEVLEMPEGGADALVLAAAGEVLTSARDNAFFGVL